MIKVNCDIGERGANHPVDNSLMEYISIANIACGGHAGNKESVDFYLSLAEKYGVMPTAHLSYPDKENFGRTSMDISIEDLEESLNSQYKLMDSVKSVKFHGALYNDLCVNSELATSLSKWLMKHDIKSVVTPFGSELAFACASLGIEVLNEGFAERRYRYENGRLLLVPRSKSYASIKECNEAVNHSEYMIAKGMVSCVVSDLNYVLETKDFPIKVDTICIHSDSEIALELAKKLSEIKG